MSFILSLTLGFLCTFGFFALCFLCVMGAKFALYTVKKYALKKEEPPKAPPKKPRKKSDENSKVVRSIEIDPNSIDRIYVKKIS